MFFSFLYSCNFNRTTENNYYFKIIWCWGRNHKYICPYSYSTLKNSYFVVWRQDFGDIFLILLSCFVQVMDFGHSFPSPLYNGTILSYSFLQVDCISPMLFSCFTSKCSFQILDSIIMESIRLSLPLISISFAMEALRSFTQSW